MGREVSRRSAGSRVGDMAGESTVRPCRPSNLAIHHAKATTEFTGMRKNGQVVEQYREDNGKGLAVAKHHADCYVWLLLPPQSGCGLAQNLRTTGGGGRTD